MPVRRPPSASRKIGVYAIAHELDAWLMNDTGIGRTAISAPARPPVLLMRHNCLKEVLITHKLSNRPIHECHTATQLKALQVIAKEIPGPVEKILDALVNQAMELCHAGSSGVSILHKEDNGRDLHWDAMAGVLHDCLGQTAPRDFSPCGLTLDQKSPQLFSYPSRYYDFLSNSPVPIVECLVIPIFVNGRAFGTLWIVSHDESREFDSGCVLIMTNLTAFCETALSYMERCSPFNLRA